MDSIDITDSAFSLEIPDVNEVIVNSGIINSEIVGGTNISIQNDNDYTTFIYLGIAILFGLIGIFVFKYYENRRKTNSEQDCPGGFCTINQNNSRQI